MAFCFSNTRRRTHTRGIEKHWSSHRLRSGGIINCTSYSLLNQGTFHTQGRRINLSDTDWCCGALSSAWRSGKTLTFADGTRGLKYCDARCLLCLSEDTAAGDTRVQLAEGSNRCHVRDGEQGRFTSLLKVCSARQRNSATHEDTDTISCKSGNVKIAANKLES